MKTGFEKWCSILCNWLIHYLKNQLWSGIHLQDLLYKKLVEARKKWRQNKYWWRSRLKYYCSFQTVKIVWPVVNFIKGNSPFMGSKDWYHRAFFNNYSQARVMLLWNLRSSESRKIARDTSGLELLLKNPTSTKSRSIPLLFIAGGNDAIFPAAFYC